MDTVVAYVSNTSKEELLKASLKAVLIAFGFSALSYLKKIWNDQKYFKRRGIAGPKFSFFMGHTRHLRKNKNSSKEIEKWTKIYGTTYGIFEGHSPFLITSDLDIIQEVFIKQFNAFPIRKKFPLALPENHAYKNLIGTNWPGRWKRMRLLMNPTFSSAKIRDMDPLIIKCIDRLIEQFEKKSEEEVSINMYMKRFTMDTIWNCAFGLDIDLQNNPENPYLVHSNQVFRDSLKGSLMRTISFVFEDLEWLIFPIYRATSYLTLKLSGSELNSINWIRSQIGNLVKVRLEQKIERKDYMQSLLNVMTEDVTTIYDQKQLDEIANEHLPKQLGRKEVEANLQLFMLAGYETTSTALSYASHILVFHQDVQRKLYEEIYEAYGSNSDKIPNTDNVKELVYLDYFVKETMRFYPIASMQRKCTKTTVIKGIDMQPGLFIRVDHRTLNFSETYWGSDAKEFNPMRHEEKRNPLLYLAFGLGPRNCVGMKFALVEMKLALIKLLLKFEFHPTENTPVVLKTYEGVVTQPEEFTILLKKRE